MEDTCLSTPGTVSFHNNNPNLITSVVVDNTSLWDYFGISSYTGYTGSAHYKFKLINSNCNNKMTVGLVIMLISLLVYLFGYVEYYKIVFKEPNG